MANSGINLSSESVQLFPYAKARPVSTLDNTFYEQNTVNLVRQITTGFFGQDSFVIGSDENSVEFNIYGYYFKVSLAALKNEFSNNLTNVKAYIKVQKGSNSTPEYLAGQDVNGTFGGLYFTNGNVPTEDDQSEQLIYSLVLYKQDGTLNTPNLGIISIDGLHSN